MRYGIEIWRDYIVNGKRLFSEAPEMNRGPVIRRKAYESRVQTRPQAHMAHDIG